MIRTEKSSQVNPKKSRFRPFSLSQPEGFFPPKCVPKDLRFQKKYRQTVRIIPVCAITRMGKRHGENG